jgi:hypothetical protein
VNGLCDLSAMGMRGLAGARCPACGAVGRGADVRSRETKLAAMTVRRGG